MSSQPVFRFAPSPNGDLHLGHAFSALVSFDLARRFEGRFLLRIEDIDIGRSRPEFEDRIKEDLHWLGLEWEQPVRRQSEHFDTYRDYAERLKAKGLLFPCFATRKEIQDRLGPGDHPKDPDGGPLYPGLFKGLAESKVRSLIAEGRPHALRLHMDRAVQQAGAREGLSFSEFSPDGSMRAIRAEPERWGDAVITRKDVPASYHLSVVVDDHLQGVTHVTRGRDLFAATDLHRLLQALFDLPAPIYHHHALITDPAGRKLAKSEKDRSLRALRHAGATPGDIRRRLGLE